MMYKAGLTSFYGPSIMCEFGDWMEYTLYPSEDKPSPNFIKWIFRNLAAQGILNVIKGIIVGKPQGEKYYEEYKIAINQVIVNKEKLP
ncbi:hypothetical protein [Clostridium carnis]